MKFIFTLFLSCLVISCAQKSKSHIKAVPIESVKWEKLNPARGDKSPQAATLWGSRKKEVPTGFLAKFVDGFSSPEHIHNVSYKAIVIEGLIHNDQAKAPKNWMPAGSYWTQPAGQPHITSAQGPVNIAFVEIDKGPYLVKPINQEFKNGEKPFNIPASKIKWQKHTGYNVASLWKNNKQAISGYLFQFHNKLQLNIETANIVIISGVIKSQNKNLKPGSVLFVKGTTSLNLLCPSKNCLIYLKSDFFQM